MVKGLGSPVAADSGDVEGAVDELVAQGQAAALKRKQGSERVTSCPPHCTHNALLPSDILIMMKVF